MDHNSLRRTQHGWTEDAPTLCPLGHQLGPNRMLVGSRNCQCGTMHRTHTCRECDQIVYTPPLTADCVPSDGGRSTFSWSREAVTTQPAAEEA
ncbi:hypothetical protein RhoFasB10_03720 [Rhodococcus sp. B10]|nr:hypothetical protein [Rhodococcus sp. B10]